MTTPITSPYLAVGANEAIPLWQGRVHLEADGNRTRGVGSIELHMLPEPTIAWRQESLDREPGVLNLDRGRLVPWGLSTSAEYLRTSLIVASGSHPLFTSGGLLPRGIEVGSRGRVSSVVFHVLNFPSFVGSPLSLGSKTWAGRTEFAWPGWTVVLDQRSDEREILSQLRSTYGYGLTHVGRLSRQDGAEFGVGRGITALDGIHHLLGFVRGGWSGPALLSGRDSQDRELWRQWTVMLVDSAKPRPSIFAFDDPAILERLAPGFMRRVQGKAWGESYRRAVGMYVAANRGVPIELGIILAQSALELLAWSTFVRSGRVGPASFTAWSAATQIRRLLQRSRIPVDIPTSVPALIGLVGVPPPADGPETVAYVRNRIVHPPRRRDPRRLSSEELVSTWRLMLSYAELVILKIAGYKGNIWSRVDDAPSVVPWS